MLPFDRAAAELHAELRYGLRHAPIGERDLLIAATAVAHGVILVTGNAAAFNRVRGLQVEDWTQES